MEVKIYCPCGTKYKFEVEPVNQSMPVPVQCPDCSQDGTEFANQIIKEKLASPPSAPVPPPAPAPVRVVAKPVQAGEASAASKTVAIRVTIPPPKANAPSSPA